MTHLNKANTFLTPTQRLHDAVDAVAGESENHIDAPAVQCIDQNIRRGVCHD